MANATTAVTSTGGWLRAETMSQLMLHASHARR